MESRNDDTIQGMHCPECGSEMTCNEPGIWICGNCGYYIEDDGSGTVTVGTIDGIILYTGP